jgi:S1-C subfamily serine protease
MELVTINRRRNVRRRSGDERLSGSARIRFPAVSASLEVASNMNRAAHRWTPTRLFLLVALLAIGAVAVVGTRSGGDDPVSPTMVQHDQAADPPLNPTTYRVQLPPLQSIDLTDAERSSMAVAAVESVGPAVVVVHRAADESQFGDRALSAGERIGSGIVIHEQGYIIASLRTTGEEGAIRVTYTTGDTVEAEIIRIDVTFQLVLLKVDDEPPAVAPIAGHAPRPGEPVLAIGSPLEDFSSTVTSGVIGAVGVSMPAEDGEEAIEGVMQHDAATNRGNEGGPLIDLHGQVVGINVGVVQMVELDVSSEDDPSELIVQGWSFAIPVTSLGPLLADLN